LPIFDCKGINAKCRMSISRIDHPAFRALLRKSEAAFVRLRKAALFSFR